MSATRRRTSVPPSAATDNQPTTTTTTTTTTPSTGSTTSSVINTTKSTLRSLSAFPDVVRRCSGAAWRLLLDLSNDWMQERYQLVQLRRQMETATSYQEWATAAVKYDIIRDKVEWTLRAGSEHYDHDLIARRLRSLRQMRRGHNATEIAYSLRAGLHRNLGGIGNPSLYTHTLVGTKVLIQDYINEVVDQLRYLATHHVESFPLVEKLVFFRETRHAFGRTALLLSGGATLTMYHLGVIKALHEANLLPRVISGSSGGAIVAAWVCTSGEGSTLERLEPESIKMGPFEELSVGSLRRKVHRFLKRGVLFDIAVLERFVRANVPDLTFLEAYRLTRRVLNITVTSTSSNGGDEGRLLNYLTAPNVLVYSAVLASCAIPGLYEPVELLAKNKDGRVIPYHPHGQSWCDGTIAHDLPTQRLSELFNINQFIVSQTNPWVVPFLPSSDETVTDMPWNFRGIVCRVWHLFGANLRHGVETLCTLGLVPKGWTRYLRLVWQRYRGDITIVPAASWGDYRRILSNPTAEYIRGCTIAAQRRTWPKLSLIRARCAIEEALDTCVRSLQREVASAALRPSGPGAGGGATSSTTTTTTTTHNHHHRTPHPVSIPATASGGPLVNGVTLPRLPITTAPSPVLDGSGYGMGGGGGGGGVGGGVVGTGATDGLRPSLSAGSWGVSSAHYSDADNSFRGGDSPGVGGGNSVGADLHGLGRSLPSFPDFSQLHHHHHHSTPGRGGSIGSASELEAVSSQVQAALAMDMDTEDAGSDGGGGGGGGGVGVGVGVGVGLSSVSGLSGLSGTPGTGLPFLPESEHEDTDGSPSMSPELPPSIPAFRIMNTSASSADGVGGRAAVASAGLSGATEEEIGLAVLESIAARRRTSEEDGEGEEDDDEVDVLARDESKA